MTTSDEIAHWHTGLDGLHARIAHRFRRGDARARVKRYLAGLLDRVERKNGWQLAEPLREKVAVEVVAGHEGIERNRDRWTKLAGLGRTKHRETPPPRDAAVGLTTTGTPIVPEVPSFARRWAVCETPDQRAPTAAWTGRAPSSRRRAMLRRRPSTGNSPRRMPASNASASTLYFTRDQTLGLDSA